MRKFKTSLVLALSLFTASTAFAQVATPGRLDHLRYVDLRDLVQFKTSIAEVASLLMRRMKARPDLFAGSTHVTFFAKGPQGPTGQVIDDNGRQVFKVTNSNSQTIHNTILSAEMESIEEEELDKVYKIQLLLFINDDQVPLMQSSHGYYFRRLSVRVNLNLPKDPEADRVEILSGKPEDYPLDQTNFRVLGDLMARKVILEDSNYKIKFVYPVAVGSFDVRTGPGMDGVVKLMTQEFPAAKIKSVHLVDYGSDGPNTRTRTYPSYFRGRPFIGLFQNGTSYEQVGMHYQITSPNLVRGFVSHGCMRVRDIDLYRLDAILNEGGHDELDAHVVNHLDGYEALDHPMPKDETSYNSVVYSTLRTGKTVKCDSSTPAYSVHYFGPYHTVADEDCLTMVAQKAGSPQPVINYILGQSTTAPEALLRDQQHYATAVQNGDTQPDISASEGGVEYKQQRQNLFCGLFGCKSRPASPGAALADKYNRSCRGLGAIFTSAKQCKAWAAEYQRMQTNPNSGGDAGGLY